MNSYMHWPTTLLNKIADVTEKSILTKISMKLPLRMTYYHQCNGLKPCKKIFIGTHAGGSQVMETYSYYGLVAHGPKIKKNQWCQKDIVGTRTANKPAGAVYLPYVSFLVLSSSCQYNTLVRSSNDKIRFFLCFSKYFSFEKKNATPGH
jgi:hypothetical protein